MSAEGRLLAKKQVFPGRTVNLFLERVALPGGAVVELEIVHHPGAACVLPLLPGGDVLLVRQWRHAAGGWLLEAPAGKLDPGEAPLACAARELLEETGHVAQELVPLGSILTTPGFCDERIHLYLGRGARKERDAALEESEVLTLQRMPFDDAVRMAASGEMEDVKTVAAIARARLLDLA